MTIKYPSLENVIERLKHSPRVQGVFSTGSTATKLSPSSDIDLVVIIDKNFDGIKSIYTIIDDRFSDIFFFDIDFINQLRDANDILGNSFDGIFVNWLLKGKIEYDPENLLSILKNKIEKTPLCQKITDFEKRDLWIKINYNYIANLRYYNSKSKIYRTALELRLLYSIFELILAYFSFRNIPWRGEKEAIKYFEQNDQNIFLSFLKYSKSRSIEQKMKHYRELFDVVFFREYQKWKDDFVVATSSKGGYDKNLNIFWDSLISN